MTTFAIFATALACVAGVAAFYRPERAFKRSAIAGASAIAAPFVIGLALTPFLGDGAGMGVMFILATGSAFVLLAAASAAVGAATRHAWMALRA